jgi:hypothetical protein
VITSHFEQHLGEAEYGIHRLSIRGIEFADCEEGPVDLRVGVYQQEFL